MRNNELDPINKAEEYLDAVAKRLRRRPEDKEFVDSIEKALMPLMDNKGNDNNHHYTDERKREERILELIKDTADWIY